MKSGSARTGKNHPRYLDLDGKKFGKLFVLKSDLPNRAVLVKCDCGKELKVNKSAIVAGASTSCGRGLCHSNTKDLTGKQFGYLTVIKFLEGKTTHSYGTLWECLCACGKTHNVVSHSLVTGQTKSCGCKTGFLYSEKATKPDNEAIINQLFLSYQSHAKKVKVNFSFTILEFKVFILNSCHYCGVDSSNFVKLKNLSGAEEFKYNGIDRVDTSSDYVIANCVTACKHCNYAKRKLSYNDFISLAKRIASRF